MGNLKRIRFEDRDLVIGQVNNAISESDQRLRVTGEEMLTIADTDDQGAAKSSSKNCVGPLLENDRQPKGAAQLPDRFFD